MAVSKQEVDSMAAIMAKLQAQEDARPAPTQEKASTKHVSTSGDPDTRAMADILSKLNSATTEVATDAAKQMINETNDPELAVAAATSRSEAGVKVANYEIVVERRQIENITKNFYNIVDNDTGEVMVADLGLFESAMSIVKRHMLGKQLQDISKIEAYDMQYNSALLEAYGYKRKLKATALTESKRDIYETRREEALAKMNEAKLKILKTL